MSVAKQLLDWATVNVAPDVISRYLSKGKVPPAKPKQKWVTRYHRTHADNAPSIDEHGLLTNNPNIGKNTWLNNPDDYHKVWLADNPREIPVLRNLMQTSPRDVTTYKVRMPEQWYLDAPRYYMPKGRGDGKMKRQPKDKPRLTDEGPYKIDLVGRDIPPQYLQKLPVHKVHELEQEHRADMYTSLWDYGTGNWMDPAVIAKLPRHVRHEANQLLNELKDNDYHYIFTAPSDDLVEATVSPTAIARNVISGSKRADADYIARQGYPVTQDELNAWNRTGWYNKTQGDFVDFDDDVLTDNLPAIPDVYNKVAKQLKRYSNSKSFAADEDVSGYMGSWLRMDPGELAEVFVHEIPAKSNTLAESDVLPVFNQLKHKLMGVYSAKYPAWDTYKGPQNWTELKPTYDINFDAAAQLLRAIDSSRPDLTQQAAGILQNNLQYYKAK